MPIRTCIDCGRQDELMHIVRSLRCKSCRSSRPRLGTRNKKTKSGYKMIQINGKRIYIHRYVMEQHLGRKLDTREHVHHVDGNTYNNELSNLQLILASDHAVRHNRERIRDKKTGKFLKARKRRI